MATLAPSIPSVKPTRSELAFADRLAYLADGGDRDTYCPGWQDDALDLGEALNCELRLAGGFFPAEPDALDLDAASWFEQVAEDAHFDDQAEEALAYQSMMAGF